MEILRNTLIRKLLFFALPTDNNVTPEERFRLIVFSLGIFMSLGGACWMAFLFFLDLDLYSLFPGSYILITAFNLFLIFDRFPKTAYSIQIIISLLFPFVMQGIMGGYIASGVVMLWSVVSFLATFALNKKLAFGIWVVVFLILFFAAFIFDNNFQKIKPAIIDSVISRNILVFNLLAIGGIVFLISLQRIELDAIIITRLQEANSQLNSYKADLEEKIAERTRDLEANLFVLKETKNEMKKALVQAREATESKSQFMTSISHEIRTPLNAILGYAQFIELKSRDLKLPAELTGYLNGIYSSGNHLLELVNNFLDISRVDSGRMVLSMETVHVRQLLNKIYDIGVGKCNEKKILLSFDITPALPEYIKIDSTKLTQILLNLISNAIKFTESGKAIRLKVEIIESSVLFIVEDEGRGINEESLSGIFDPFIQLNKPGDYSSEGFGLGLAITKRLVVLFGGSIEVSSKVGVGTVFTVKLPLIRAVDPHVNYTDDLKSRRVRFLSGQKVLIVEDNPVNIQLLESLLKEFGLSVSVAVNGRDGIEKAIDGKPDVIFMDIHMPVMDGLEALKHITADDRLRHIPVICLTADVFGSHKSDPLSMGFSDHLTKPIDFNRLIAVLEKYLLTDLS